jgi:hypothetical protein
VADVEYLLLVLVGGLGCVGSEMACVAFMV